MVKLTEAADFGVIATTLPPVMVIRNPEIREYLDLPDHVGGVIIFCEFDPLNVFGKFTVDLYRAEEQLVEVPIQLAAIMELPEDAEDGNISVH